MEFSPEKFSLRKAIEEVCAVTQSDRAEEGHRSQSERRARVGDVTLDQQKFKQVLYNLLSNAIKFTHDGGKVEIRAAMHDAHHFKLVVEDTGIGIKTEDLHDFSRPLNSSNPARPSRRHGTGPGINTENRGVTRRYTSAWRAKSGRAVALRLCCLHSRHHPRRRYHRRHSRRPPLPACPRGPRSGSED